MSIFNTNPILRWTGKILMVVGLLAIAFIIGVLGTPIYNSYFSRPVDPRIAAVAHEFAVQVEELQIRIQLCNQEIDHMNPGYTNGATFHCTMMWNQMKKVQAFATQMHIQNPVIRALNEASFRAGGRYAEYQTGINNPFFKSSQRPQD